MNLSIVIPSYNEGEKIKDNMKKLFQYMTKNHPYILYEIILVNDGSLDNTKKIGQELEFMYPEFKIISYDCNQGKGYAVMKGLEAAVGDLILFMDTDLSTHLSAIDQVLLYQDEYDLVIASRQLNESAIVKPQSFIRKQVGKICSLLTNLIIPLKIKDTQCGFKAMKKDLAREIIKKQQIKGFAFDVEYLYIAKLNHYKVKEIPVVWHNDDDSKVVLIKSSIYFFRDLLKIRFKKEFYKIHNKNERVD